MRTDVLIIGAGLAGLACALESQGSVVLVNDTSPARDVASAWAQGGLAAALGPDDAPALHAADTLSAAAGLADPRVVKEVTADAPAAIALLENWGVPFDRHPDGSLALGLEAAHSRRRIVHAADHTGATIVRRLLDIVATRPNIRLTTGLRCTDLIQADDGRVSGAIFMDVAGRCVQITARAVVLASGGYGGLYAKTTTPPATLGAGIALAQRAGAALADLEFVQFHPTAFACGTDPMPLLSEALRGEGATLIDESGQRFTDELAARDIVSRAIFALEESGGRAFLDARTAIGATFSKRFPSIYARCLAGGIDPSLEPIPITPAAHYTIGGVVTDLHGRTVVRGLWACGEVAATGLHGANRLASNSLIEALIFGTRAARDISAEWPTSRHSPARQRRQPRLLVADLAAVLLPLRAVMSAFVGVVRDQRGLTRAIDRCNELAISEAVRDPRVRDAVEVSRAVASAALVRRESRGTHFRRDSRHLEPRLPAAAGHAIARSV